MVRNQLYQMILTAQLTVNETYLEKVGVHKVLSITLCDDLKWGQNTKEIVDQTCERLYLLRVLKRACVPCVIICSVQTY